MLIINKPCSAVRNEWRLFLTWLSNQTINTVWDFRSKIKIKYEIVENDKYLKVRYRLNILQN